MSKVYDIITNQIIEMLEEGTVPWQKPWDGQDDVPRNYKSKKTYRGINLMLLQYAALKESYRSPYWLSFLQIKELGGHLRYNEKSTMIVFWKINKKDTGEFNASGDEVVEKWPILRYYRVFNADQVDWNQDLKDEMYPGVTEVFNPIVECDKVLENWKDMPEVLYGGDRAFYSPSLDKIKLPNKSTFKSPETYYATLFHESIHATGHESRLKRSTLDSTHSFGDINYSKEELIAEMGATFLCGHVGIESHIIENASAYIKSWIKILKGDNKFIISASAKAQKAVDHILGTTFEN